MATFSELTVDEQTQLADQMTIIRPMVGALARVCNSFRIAKDAHTSHVGAILAQLVDADEVPNTTGLAGAVAITKAEIDEVLTDANAVLAAYDTPAKRQLYTRFAGARNLIGG